MTAHSRPIAIEPIPPATGSLPFAGRRMHFIGIGGCGMSGLARLVTGHGAICTGSDQTPSATTSLLAGQGIEVSFDQQQGYLPANVDLVVASAAIAPDHPEMLAALDRGIEVIRYAEMLGMLQTHHTGVSIAGTHGKSTTSALLCHVLIMCGLDPSFIVGATCPQIGGGSRTGAGRIPGGGPLAGRPGLLIAEACEFNRSFHHHRPIIGLINNIEADHLDIYGSLDAVIGAFAEFARLLPPAEEGGRLLIAHDGAHRREVTAGLPCEIEDFGFSPGADYQVVLDAGIREVALRRDGRTLATWTSSMPGEHNALNTAAAAILASYCGATWDAIGEAISSFRGVERRMQRLGARRVPGGEVILYDDYGHHPTEIESTLRALRQHELPRVGEPTDQRLICVFQPHQHSRTRFLLEEFATSFEQADMVIVPHIYFVRDSEVEKTRVSAADLVDRLRTRGVAAMHLYPFDAIVEQLEVICRPGDLVVIMGAGPVWQVAREFMRRQPEEARASRATEEAAA